MSPNTYAHCWMWSSDGVHRAERFSTGHRRSPRWICASDGFPRQAECRTTGNGLRDAYDGLFLAVIEWICPDTSDHLVHGRRVGRSDHLSPSVIHALMQGGWQAIDCRIVKVSCNRKATRWFFRRSKERSHLPNRKYLLHSLVLCFHVRNLVQWCQEWNRGRAV